MATSEHQSAAAAKRLMNFDVKIEWFGDVVKRDLGKSMRGRVMIACQLLRDRIVVNLAKPVVKVKSRNGRTRVDPASRSKPGEFPRADTTRLMKDIFWDMQSDTVGRVGTTLDYGLVLETRMDRSFLVRTLKEMSPRIRSILVAPIKGKQ